MSILYCSICGDVLARGKCENTGHEPWFAPADMEHKERSFLNAMRYDSTITQDYFRQMYLDRCVHRLIKTRSDSRNSLYVAQLGEMGSHKRVLRMIEILEGLSEINSAMGGNNNNRKVDIEYLRKEYLDESNFKFAEPL